MLHSGEEGTRPDFYEYQSVLMGKFLKKDPPWVREKTDMLIYRNWERFFSGIELFPQVEETLAAFRRAGLRLGVLSDFPPERKLELLGLDGAFDVVLSSEKTGFLKPHPEPFKQFSRAMGLAPEEILYVGNSSRYDAAGAEGVGMKAALIRRSFFSTGSRESPVQGCFTFSGYRQLQEFVLG
jgi:putative hydrolase of the HAD superfamily